MPKAPAAVPPAALARYEKLVAALPAVERKGATVPYTSVNGHMFSYLTKSGSLALRLPPDDRAAFLAKYDAQLAEAYGIVQKEFVAVPDALFAKTSEITKWMAKSFAWVSARKPKPTTRGNAKRKRK